jgi:hypothetical protein
MPDMFLTSPAIPSEMSDSFVNTGQDPHTVVLRDALNAVTPYQPTMPPVFNTWVRSTGPGIGDSQYDVGYKQVPVGNQVIPMILRFEAPDVPVTHLPFRAVLYDSSLPYQQSQNLIIYPNLRSPAINEGY